MAMLPETGDASFIIYSVFVSLLATATYLNREFGCDRETVLYTLHHSKIPLLLI